MNIGPTELLIVLAIVLLIFGSTQLPKLRAFHRFREDAVRAGSPRRRRVVPRRERQNSGR